MTTASQLHLRYAVAVRRVSQAEGRTRPLRIRNRLLRLDQAPLCAQEALPAWAAGLAVPPDDHIAQACAAYGRRNRWSSRKPAAGSDSDHSGAEHKALSGSAAVDWKRTLDNWDRWEPELSPLLCYVGDLGVWGHVNSARRSRVPVSHGRPTAASLDPNIDGGLCARCSLQQRPSS